MLKRILSKIAGIFDRIIDSAALLSIIIIAVITVMITVEVITRYFFNIPIPGSVEIGGFALVYITFLGAPWLLRREGHVRMDFLVSRVGPRTLLVLNVITSMIGAIACIVIAWYSAKFTWDAFQQGYFMPTELKTPVVITTLAIPICSFLLFSQFIRRTYGFLRSRSLSSHMYSI
jgi:TRAP-type C4-dicarboxylate transport system permease small subunit